MSTRRLLEFLIRSNPFIAFFSHKNFIAPLMACDTGSFQQNRVIKSLYISVIILYTNELWNYY
jgi:hypothetical protein